MGNPQATDVTCDRCHVRCIADGITTGYGRDESGRTFCFACCGQLDSERLERDGRGMLYLSGDRQEVSNWPGTLRCKVRSVRKGRHNIAGERIDVWFKLHGAWWHGTQYGRNTQICHVRRTKEG